MRRMTSKQFTGWRAFLDAEGLSGEHQDRRYGEIWALVANALRDTKKRSQPYVWTDGFTKHRRRKPKGPRETLAEARAMFNQGMAVGRWIAGHGEGPGSR